MEAKQDDTKDNTHLESPQANVSSNSTQNEPLEMDIDPENEVKGMKLLLIHTGICLCTFLVGLVSNDQNVLPTSKYGLTEKRTST